jgi:sugar phosphate isomerase/epimerase
MIKLSLQSLCYRDTFNAGKITMLEIIDKAAEYRMDGVDLHFTHFASIDDDYLEEVKQACLKRGLHMCYIGVSNNFGKTGAELREQIDLMKKWIDVAAHMGIPMVRTFGSWVPDGESDESAWPRLVESTKEVAEYGESKGVVVGLHNHNHGCIPATGDQVIRLLDDVDNPYYSHILDTGQYLGSPGVSLGERGKEDPEWNFYGSIETSAPRAVHVRAKIYRIASGEEAWLDYDRIMPIIRNVGFNGWMSIVFEGQDELDEPTAVPLANSFMRSMLAKYEM